MLDITNDRDPRMTKLIESERSDSDRLDGLLEYVAMMTDVELPEDGGEGGE